MQVQQLKEQAYRAVTVDVFDDTDAAGLIPLIRQAVSDCAAYAATASDKADIATDKAGIASDKADVATDKAAEAVNTLSGKAEVDLSNLSTAGRNNIANLSAPSNRYIDYPIPGHNVQIEAPADGYFCFRCETGTAGDWFELVSDDGTDLGMVERQSYTNVPLRGFIPVRSGEKIKVYRDNDGSMTVNFFRFVYAQGA